MVESNPHRIPPPFSGSCFVMMPFASPFDRYYRNIFVPAIRNCGLVPIRGDGIFGSAIVSDIWHAIKKSTLALADLTGKNPNVFYELGLAHAIGKAVILVASNTADVPIDLGGLRVILYDKDDENWGQRLQENIQRSIDEILREPSRGTPAAFSDAQVQACLAGDPLHVEIRQLAEEVRALRFGMNSGNSPEPQRNLSSDVTEATLAEVFPHARKIGLSWGQTRHVIDLLIAGKDSEAQGYIENTGADTATTEAVLTLLRDRCRRLR